MLVSFTEIKLLIFDEQRVATLELCAEFTMPGIDGAAD